MSSRYANLLSRLKAAAAPWGKKGELASFLGVHQSRLSEWLAGRYEPGAEVTLRMLEWVQAEEEKQQESRGSASTPPRPKTRKLNHSNEKSSQVPRKGKPK